MATAIRRINSDMTEDRKGDTKAAVKMQVQFDTSATPADRVGPADPLDLTAVPQIGDSYTYNGRTILACICVGRKCKQRETHPDLFDLDIEYDSAPSTNGDSEPNPLLRPPKYSWDFDAHQKVVNKDLAGVWKRNTVGDAFTDIPPTDDNRPIAVIKRNESTFPVPAAEFYQNAINSTPMTVQGHSFGAQVIKVQKISSGEIQREGGIDFYTITYELAVNRENWKTRILNKGQQTLNTQADNPKGMSDGTTPQPAVDARGVPLPNEVMLTEDGKQLDPFTDPNYREYDDYKLRDLNVLGL